MLHQCRSAIPLSYQSPFDNQAWHDGVAERESRRHLPALCVPLLANTFSLGRRSGSPGQLYSGRIADFNSILAVIAALCLRRLLMATKVEDGIAQ